MTTFAVPVRRLAAAAAAVTLCVMASGVANADSDARAKLLAAIANTKGSYFVYNFGGEFAAPFRNAAGEEYTLNSGGHLMTIKNASSRLNPRLLVDTHQGYQAPL